jgi:hypothetical protein
LPGRGEGHEPDRLVAGEPASRFVPHAGAVRGFVPGVAAGSLNEVT